MGTSGAVKPAAVTVPPLELVEIALLALACSLPVVLIGGLIIRVSRSWSLTVSMVALVLIPTLATFSGVIGASGFMITGTFARIAVVLVIVSVVTLPAAVMLARYQARRMVWEQEIRDSERAAEQSRRQLVAFVSHDLRTPLAGIRALSEAITDGVVEEDEVLTTAKRIEQESIRLSEMVDDLFEQTGRKVSIIGWSLGGVFARELAKLAPEKVRLVISLGSPISDDRNHTNARRLFEYLNGEEPEPMKEGNFAKLGEAPPVPTTSILTKTDGVVHWRGSVQFPDDANHGQTENIEVLASHCGMGVNPAVMFAIADRLAQKEGNWKPFHARGLASLFFPRTRLLN